MNKLDLVIVISCLATSLLPGCKKDMPPVVAERWAAIEDLARAAGPSCDRVLALAECPLKSEHVGPDKVPDTEVGAHYFDPKGPQIGVRWTCGGNKPYPGWEHTKDGLALAYDKDCQENLYHAWMRRKSPAGNTVQAAVYFYVDGHPPAVAPTPGPQ